MTENWLSLALPSMYAMCVSSGIDVIDAYKYFGAMAHEHKSDSDMEKLREEVRS